MKVTAKYSAPDSAMVTVTITATLGELKRLNNERLGDKPIEGWNSLAEELRRAILESAARLHGTGEQEVSTGG